MWTIEKSANGNHGGVNLPNLEADEREGDILQGPRFPF